jgi:hypothetical protein
MWTFKQHGSHFSSCLSNKAVMGNAVCVRLCDIGDCLAMPAGERPAQLFHGMTGMATHQL